MTTNTEREELARELFVADNGNQSREQSLVDWEWFESTDNYRGRIQHYKDMAAGMITAGYTRPRTITTVEELDALPVGTILRDDAGWPWHIYVDSEGFRRCRGAYFGHFPAMVLYTPEPTK